MTNYYSKGQEISRLIAQIDFLIMDGYYIDQVSYF